MRHNAIKDTEASIMKDIAYDVETEPALLPLGNVQLANGTKTEANARLDISARGIWCANEKTFFDVRITHPHAPSNAGKSIEQLFEQNEQEKLRHYNDHVLQVEKASLVPLVFSTNGGMSRQCKKLHKQLATLICQKKGERFSVVIAHMRTRLRFALLKCTLIALRGYRGKKKKEEDLTPFAEVDFGLLDESVW